MKCLPISSGFRRNQPALLNLFPLFNRGEANLTEVINLINLIYPACPMKWATYFIGVNYRQISVANLTGINLINQTDSINTIN